MGFFDFFKKKTADKSNIENAGNGASVQPTPSEQPKKRTASKEKGQKHRLAGVKYYEKNIMKLATEDPNYALTKDKIIKAGLAENTIFKFTFPDGPVSLEPEPDNEHDPNAVKVILAGQHIGYIKAGSCSRVKNQIANGRIEKIVCNLSGGPYKEVIDINGDIEEEKPDYHMERGTADFYADIRVFLKE